MYVAFKYEKMPPRTLSLGFGICKKIQLVAALVHKERVVSFMSEPSKLRLLSLSEGVGSFLWTNTTGYLLQKARHAIAGRLSFISYYQ